MTDYVELHCHSAFSLREGASLPEELVLRAHALGYRALALTDHDGLYGAMAFAQAAKAWGIRPVTGAEITLTTGHHLTLLAADRAGYANLCRLITAARGTRGHGMPAVASYAADAHLPSIGEPSGGHGSPAGLSHAFQSPPFSAADPPHRNGSGEGVATGGHPASSSFDGAAATPEQRAARPANRRRAATAAPPGPDREHPLIDPALLPAHAGGLILLSGCRQGEVAARVAAGDHSGAEAVLRTYREWFGPEHVYVELQQNLVFGDTARNAALADLARQTGLRAVATGNVHYHVRERHQLQDVLVAIRHRTTLDGSHRQRRPNSEFYLKSPAEIAVLFRDYPEAIRNTMRIADQCAFNLATDLDYAFPDYPTPSGEPPDGYLAALCQVELVTRYGRLDPDLRRRAEERLAEELRLIALHKLAGFFLHYRELLLLARQVADEVHGRDPRRPRDWQPAGRGRGSSVGSIVCYLIGLSHIDPIKNNLFLGRFLNEELSSVPDIDLDFPREVREALLRRLLEGETPARPALPPVAPPRAPRLDEPGAAAFSPMPANPTRADRFSDPDAGGPWTGHVDEAAAQKPSAPGAGSGSPTWRLTGPAPGQGQRGEHGQSPAAAAAPVPLLGGRAGGIGPSAALVCTFPTYQIRSAVREVGKALGLPEAELDKLAKSAAWVGGAQLAEEMARLPEFRDRVGAPLWRDLVRLAAQIDGLPRHVSQHVGGVILSSRPLAELAPLEPAAMEGRVLCGWDKDSVDDARFIKIDFLALGMLSLVDECLELIREGQGQFPDLGRIPHDDPRVYDMICRGDTLGVFQIESRAQIQTLPRTRPRTIEDLIVEVAIIRPGPITGGALNPYILRRQGREPVSYDHPSLAPVLAETLGVILFQEQVLQAAMAVAGFTAGQAETLRRAMSRKRSREAMTELWQPFQQGALARGVDEATARLVFDKLLGFAAYGFPKSHSAAFALLAYESAWLKLHYPVEFYCALFNNQPMGFYSPAVLTGDARRHGVRVLRPDINYSRDRCTVERGGEEHDGDWERPRPALPAVPPAAEAVRLGFAYVDGISEATATALAAERERGGPYRALSDFIRRTGLRREAIEHLIAVGAFDDFGLGRRELLWQLGLLRGQHPRGGAARPTTNARQGTLPLPVEQDMVRLPEAGTWERMVTDYRVLGLSPEHHPLALLRRRLGEGYPTSALLEQLRDGMAVTIAGMVVCRQRPVTAKGFCFLSLEDEYGLANVIIRPPLYERRRALIRTEPFLLVSGLLQRRDHTTNLLAREVQPLRVPAGLFAPQSKDWG